MNMIVATSKNLVPNEIKESESLNTFKFKFKAEFLKDVHVPYIWHMQETADLVISDEEILNGKLHFLSSDMQNISWGSGVCYNIKS